MIDLKSVHAAMIEKRTDITVSAIICVAVGAVVMVWPIQTIVLLCKTLALLLLIMGVANLLTYVADKKTRRFGLISGVVLILLGTFVMVRPTTILQIFSIAIGVVLVLHGIKDIQLVMEGKEYEEKRWWLPSLLATVTLMFGLCLIWSYFQAPIVVIWFFGMVLFYDGMSDLIILAKVKAAQKAAHQEAETIDVGIVEKEE